MGKFRKNAGVFFILIVIITLVCTSCSKNSGGILAKTPNMNVPFESDMKIQAGELELSGHVKRYGTGLWEMTVDSPETLAGLSLSYNDEGVKAVLDGLELDIPMEDINDKAVFALLFKAIDNAAAADKLVCTETEEGQVFTGEFSYGSYSITFEPESAVPVKIAIPEAELCGEFENFRILTDTTEESSDTVNTSETVTETE